MLSIKDLLEMGPAGYKRYLVNNMNHLDDKETFRWLIVGIGWASDLNLTKELLTDESDEFIEDLIDNWFKKRNRNRNR